VCIQARIISVHEIPITVIVRIAIAAINSIKVTPEVFIQRPDLKTSTDFLLEKVFVFIVFLASII